MIADQTRQLAHHLRLFGIHAHLERRAAEALASQMHPLEFLRLLLEDEALFRKDRVAKILATRARFRSAAEIADWDGTYDRGIAKPKLKELASLGFFLSQENRLLLGKTGEGKTHLAVALGRRLCAEGIQTTCLPVNLLFEEIAAARAAGKYLHWCGSSTSPRCSYWTTSAFARTHTRRRRLSSICAKTAIGVVSWWSRRKSIRAAGSSCSKTPSSERPSSTACQRVVLKGGSYRERLAKKPG